MRRSVVVLLGCAIVLGLAIACYCDDSKKGQEEEVRVLLGDEEEQNSEQQEQQKQSTPPIVAQLLDNAVIKTSIHNEISSTVRDEIVTTSFMLLNKHQTEEDEGIGEEKTEGEKTVEKQELSNPAQDVTNSPTQPQSSSADSTSSPTAPPTSDSSQSPSDSPQQPQSQQHNNLNMQDTVKQMMDLLKKSGVKVGKMEIKVIGTSSLSVSNTKKRQKNANLTKALHDANLTLQTNVSKAIQLFLNISEEFQEDSVALHNLAMLYKNNQYGVMNLTLSKHYYLRSAMRGNPSAQFYVGFLWSNGYITDSDINVLEHGAIDHRLVPYVKNLTNQQFDPESLAVSNYFFSALAGNLRSQIALGYRHLYGLGVPKLCSSAAYYYKLAAGRIALELVTSSAMVDRVRLSDDIGMRNRQSQNDIMEFYRYSAQNGNPAAQVVVGVAHMHGMRGVERNGELAREYLERAAEMGEPEAFGPLGNMYAKGISVPQDNKTAFDYFKRGTELGDASSFNGLGYLYLHGSGVKQDLRLAAHYFNQSASQGNAEGQYNLGVLYMGGLGVTQNYKIALQYMTLAAQNGQTLAHYQLGIMHLHGLGIEANCNVAVKYFKYVVERGNWANTPDNAYDLYMEGDYAAALLQFEEAAELGSEIAQSNAAYMLDHMLGHRELLLDRAMEHSSKSNMPLESSLEMLKHMHAMRLYKLAAEQGNVEAFVKVGDAYYYGLGTPALFDKAVHYYRKAADMRNAQAMYNMGYMHENGLGIPQDFHLAKRYYDMAAETEAAGYVPVVVSLGKLYVRWGLSLLFGSDGKSTTTTTARNVFELLSEYEDTILGILFASLGLVFFFRQLYIANREFLRVRHHQQAQVMQQ